MRTIVWFRGKDLRVSDHAPLVEAAASGEVVPLFVLDPYFFAPDRARAIAHRMQFLLESLASLQANLGALGSRLVLVEGRAIDVVPRLSAAWRADRVVAHRWTEPFGRKRDEIVRARGVNLRLYEGETLCPPGTLRSGSGGPFAVFSPFARAFRKQVVVGRPLPAPRSLPPLPVGLDAGPGQRDAPPTLEALGIARNPALQAGGERAARARLVAFVEGAAARYADERDRMDLASTSRLSADLKFGTLSARTAWWAAIDALEGREPKALLSYTNELLWREFSHELLHQRPDLLERPFRPEFQGFPWSTDARLFEAWAAGRTGYPVVDAAARQLLAEGFVHNRARMIAASFLTKNLMVDFRLGEAHYMRHLTDGDWAQNDAGWQWSAGCGCDAQPYFRVFNPVSQGERFDPDGAYVKRYVPELRGLPAKCIHAPFDAPPMVLREAGVRLGDTYPRPIVDLSVTRERFLEVAKAHLAQARASGGR